MGNESKFRCCSYLFIPYLPVDAIVTVVQQEHLPNTKQLVSHGFELLTLMVCMLKNNLNLKRLCLNIHLKLKRDIYFATATD